MLKSKEALFGLARKLDHKPEIIEKVDRLLSCLKQIMSVAYLRERLVLKGGTALNLFSFEGIPRLSVDIDLNYIGEIDKTKMLKERQEIDNALKQICYQNRFEPYRNPNHHAGGKMVWRYPSLLGQGGNIEIDINYMYRIPIYSCTKLNPKIDLGEVFAVPTLDIHELAAGKLSALFSRYAGRDLFDVNYLLTKCDLDLKKLRLVFVVYLAMTTIDLSKLSVDKLEYDILDMKNKLLPVLHQQKLPRQKHDLIIWANDLLCETKNGLKKIFPLTETEVEFIENIRTKGFVYPSLITKDKNLQKTILTHPAIKWAAMRFNRN